MKLISHNETMNSVQATNRRIIGKTDEMLLITKDDNIDDREFLSHIWGCKFNIILYPHIIFNERIKLKLQVYLYENGQIITY